MSVSSEKQKKLVRRRIEGVVVSNKMQKTVVVEASRLMKHPKYGKYFKKFKKLKVHDEKQEARPGDRVEFVECRPISKEKMFRLSRIIERSKTGGETDKAVAEAS